MEPLSRAEMEHAGTLVIMLIMVGALAFGLICTAYFNLVEWLDRRRATTERPTERPERRTDGTPRANADERGSEGANVQSERPETDELQPDLAAIVRAIAAHKLTAPDDGKAETIYTVFRAKKGSSRAYQAASTAWDWLYPPPAPPQIPTREPLSYVVNGERFEVER